MTDSNVLPGQNSTCARAPSVIPGVLIIAGTTVGAGMFSMPVVTAGMWYSWSIVFIVVTWFCMYHSSLMILETNLNYAPGASFNTIIKDTLGKSWNLLNGLAIVFVLYILTYAYISAGGSIVSHLLADNIGAKVANHWGSIFFAVTLGSIVWVSTGFVGRITTILLAAMAMTFVLSLGQYGGSVSIITLFPPDSSAQAYWPYIFVALPFFLTSFGFHGNVPSLMKHYGKQPQKIKHCLFYGSLTALAVYALWQTIVLGNVERAAFGDVIAAGGNIPALLSAMENSSQASNTEALLTIFANLAIVSSFLGVTLGLFDFVSDRFKFSDDLFGRLKTASITFIPPTLTAVFFPNGFLYAIGFAGLVAAIWTVIVPALAVRISRSRYGNPNYRVWGGDYLVWGLLAFAGLYAVCHILAMLDLLPVLG